MNAPGSTRLLRWAVAALLAATATTQAAEQSTLVTLGLGAEYTDNVRRVTDNEESDTILTASFNSDLRRITPRIDVGFTSDLHYDYYTQGSFDPELHGNALLDFDGQIVRNRLSWYINDTFGQLRTAALSPDTPDNRENVNVFTTGPRFTQPIGSRSRFILVGVYELESYEESALDATRTGADLSFRHDLTPHQYLELTATTRSTRYDEDVAFGDYDENEYFLTWSATGARTTVTASAGQTQTDAEGLNDDASLFRLDAERSVGKYGTLSLTGRSERASTVDAFRLTQGQGTVDTSTQPYTAVAEPLDLDYLGFGYSLAGRRLSGSLHASSERDRYVLTDQNDHDRNAFEAGFEWVISPTWNCGLNVEYARETYIVTDQRFKELNYTLDARVRLTRALSLKFGGTLSDRSGDVGTNAYDETRAHIMLTYTGGKSG